MLVSQVLTAWCTIRLVAWWYRGKIMDKKAVITVRLVEESAEHLDEEIEKEIYSELLEEGLRIPWAKEIEKVTVESS